MIKRRALGKGLDAIISNTSVAIDTENRVLEIDVDLIFPNPFQPRKIFKEDKIEELAQSISESGLIQPIVVFEDNGKYFLIVGERRLRAIQKLKWKKIPVIVKKLEEEQIAVNALLENIQREDLNAIEIAEGLRLLLDKGKVTHEMIGQKLGMNRTTVTNYVRLLKLPSKIQESIKKGEISPGHARTLLSFEDEEKIWSLYNDIVDKKLSVRQAELLSSKGNKEKSKISEIYDDPDIKKIEEKLARFFSTKVLVSAKKNGSGKIELYFENMTAFDRIYQLINKECCHE